jgi:hypothetical protein
MTDNTGDAGGILGFPLPGGFLEAMAAEQQQGHMERDALRLQLNIFVDSLDRDQLLALTRLLALRRTGLDVYRGQAGALLRTKYNVDELTGEPLMPQEG